MMVSIKRKRTFFYGLGASAILALPLSAYTETYQQSFFASLKNIVFVGQPSAYSEKDGITLKFHYGEMRLNPVAIAQQVLAFSEGVLIENSELKITPYKELKKSDFDVLRVANYLIQQYRPEEIGGEQVLRFPYEFSYPPYGLGNPWYSGMAQGHAIIVLLHAYLISSDQRYLEYSRKVYRVLTIPISEGGVQVITENDGVIFEEYADPSLDLHESPRVLNGNIFAIDGIFWFWLITGSEEARDLLVLSIESVERMLPLYESVFWSYYDLRGNYANGKYHSLHLKQIQRLAEYAGILQINSGARFEEMYNKWYRFRLFSFVGYLERMLLNRNRMIYVIYVSSVFGLVSLLFLGMLITRIKTAE